jgi:predicted O-methyltransferase YrrM
MDLPDQLPSWHIEHIMEEREAFSNYAFDCGTAIEKSQVVAKKLSSRQKEICRSLMKGGILLKQQAFASMEKLQGWCSREKAAVLIDIILALRPQTVVEIGVFGGKSLVPMALALNYTGSGKIYGIDPWSSQESAKGLEGEHQEWWSALDHDSILASLWDEIQISALTNVIELRRMTSESCPPIAGIDIIHIDGNHSADSALFDVTKWVPLLKEGGLIIFDDLNWESTSAAVAWLDAHCQKIAEFHGDNIWGVWMK